jgi:RNA-binding protein
VKPVSAKLTTLVHATEDIGKVSRALDQVCPALMFEQKSETRKFRGHYGNEIATLTVSVRRHSAGQFSEYLLKLLPRGERALLIQDLDNRIDDDGHLYLRLDKQACVRGNFHLLDQDPIKCELSFKIDKADPLNPRDQIKQYLSSMIDP